MSLKVGLGASQDDIDVQGEIDFDFFDDNIVSNDEQRVQNEENERNHVTSIRSDNSQDDEKDQFANMTMLGDSDVTSHVLENVHAPESVVESLITLPYVDEQIVPSESVQQGSDATLLVHTSADSISSVQKTLIEAVIPTLQDDVQRVIKHSDKEVKSINKATIKENTLCYNTFNDNGYSGGSRSSSATDTDGVPYLSDDSLNGLTESESFTSVSPLPSPFCPVSSVPQSDSKVPLLNDSLKCIDHHNRELKVIERTLDVSQKKKEGVKFSDDVNWDSSHESDSIDLNLLLSAIRQLEAQQSDKISADGKWGTPVRRGRKNMTFSNEDVRKIDQENRRLLKKIVAQQTRPRPKYTPSHPTIVPSSAVNRYRQQRQIEIENLALLKRLESAKPSRDVNRNYLLKEFDRLTNLPASSNACSRPHSASRYSSVNPSSRNSACSSSRSSVNSIHSAGKTRVTSSASLHRVKTARSSSAVVRTRAWQQ